MYFICRNELVTENTCTMIYFSVLQVNCFIVFRVIPVYYVMFYGKHKQILCLFKHVCQDGKVSYNSVFLIGNVPWSSDTVSKCMGNGSVIKEYCFLFLMGFVPKGNRWFNIRKAITVMKSIGHSCEKASIKSSRKDK